MRGQLRRQAALRKGVDDALEDRRHRHRGQLGAHTRIPAVLRTAVVDAVVGTGPHRSGPAWWSMRVGPRRHRRHCTRLL